ncbi:hypothetical protein [Methylocapsa acidiphila]|uniref:hypothetical protein n=1 Tax=Methylocapsa acidiphila TaxID=133552 RepID=UPI00040D22AB|nr:hypothetical protein [Methylocapsa acidiphila]
MAADRHLDGLTVELAFLSRYGAPPEFLRLVQAQAREQAISPDAALLATGVVDESFYYSSIARHLGLPFTQTDHALGAGARYPHSIHAGVAPLQGDMGLHWLAAPRGAALADLLRAGGGHHLASAGLAITTPAHLSRLVQAFAAPTIAAAASLGLSSVDPSFSAKDGATEAQRRIAVIAVAIAALLLALAPTFAWTTLSLSLNGLFLAAIMLRLFAGSASVAAASPPSPIRLPDRMLPTYSIVIALHREARIVAQLATALQAIDYPGIMAQPPQEISQPSA